ncbi:MAG: endolytic transglycosylase MltG, partial [Terriglobales bacterium]
VVEGWRLEQIAEAVGRAGLPYGPTEFLQAASYIPPDHPLATELPGGASLEGFLFPDTYRLETTGTAQDLVDSMLETFQLRVPGDQLQAFHAQGLLLYEAVTLASIVEREAIVPDERPLIAGVFLRRLRTGLPLESDPTVQYALGQQPTGDWWKSPLTLVDLENASPYNTYHVTGLPPGPIANPGRASLEAVLNPPATKELFFVADGTGGHAFAETLEQHNKNVANWRKIQKEKKDAGTGN